jgi:hypothetical protein
MPSHDVLKRLGTLDSKLSANGLQAFKPFNNTYVVITEAINRGIATGFFDDPKTVERLELAFAKLYFIAIDQFARDRTLPGRWKVVRQKFLPAGISLMLGARAHITQDLAPAMRESVKDPAVFRNDFKKIDTLLLGSSTEILKRYHASNTLVSLFKKGLRFIYEPLSMKIIMRWHQQAWDEYTSGS